MAAVDVDPEAVRMALRDFVQQLANAERERVGWILYHKTVTIDKHKKIFL